MGWEPLPGAQGPWAPVWDGNEKGIGILVHLCPHPGMCNVHISPTTQDEEGFNTNDLQLKKWRGE